MADMAAQFAHPLAWAVAAAAVLPWAQCLWSRRRGRWLPLWGALLESAAIVCLAGALAGTRVRTPSAAVRPVAVFVDVSASQASLPEAISAQFPADMRRVSYVFAGEVGQGAAQTIDPRQSLIGPVLRLIAATADRHTAAVIVTDGRFTSLDDFAAEAEAVRRTGLPVLVVPRAPDKPDVRVVDLVASVRPNNQVDLLCTVVSTATMPCRLRLTRVGADEPILDRTLELLANDPAAIRAADNPPPDRSPRYTAELLTDDLLRQNNKLATIAPPKGQDIAWADPADLRPLVEASLASQLLRFLPADLPDTVDGLLGYSAVVVFDTTGEALSPAQRKALAEYVHLGGGMVLVGTGPHASPQDRTDPLNELLPLTASPYERKNLDVTVLLDTSGSMADPATQPVEGRAAQTRIAVARQALLSMARRQLTGGDYLRVITFSTGANERFAGPADEESLLELERRLATIRPIGGTAIAPSLRRALELTPREGLDRLVIVLSDLQTRDARFDPAKWARRLADKGLSLAVVATGDYNPKAPLKVLADLLAGQFVYHPELSELEDIFAQFLRTARGDVIVKGARDVRIHAPPFGASLTALPNIDAYIAAATKPGATLLASTAGGQPILARRRAELGRAVTLSLPLTGGFNMRWRSSPDVAKLLSAAVRWVRSAPGDKRFEGELNRGAPAIVLTIRAFNGGQPVNGLGLTATVTEADGRTQSVELPQQAPGTYSAALGPIGSAAATVEVRETKGRVVWRRAMPGRYPLEYAHIGVDADALDRLASLTGGTIVSADAVPGRLQRLTESQFVEIWPYLVGASLVLALIDWLGVRLVRKPARAAK